MYSFCKKELRTNGLLGLALFEEKWCGVILPALDTDSIFVSNNARHDCTWRVVHVPAYVLFSIILLLLNKICE